MKQHPSRLSFGVMAAFVLSLAVIFAILPNTMLAESSYRPIRQSNATATPVFRYPVVPLATISGFFDHKQHPTPTVAQDKDVRFYNGRASPSTSGFNFSCPAKSVNSWVGCAIPNNGTEAGCPNNQEMWYDQHKGLDFEYAANWHTGDTCNLNQFVGITRNVYSPAAGKVDKVDFDFFNGHYLMIKHDLNRNNNYDDDKFRSVYLHFDNGGIGVSVGQIVNEGTLLGIGGMVGLAWTPHLHFEVQRASNVDFAHRWAMDPYGWSLSGSDPWFHNNYPLWQSTLFEAIWRGNQGFIRSVPIKDSVVQWSPPIPWSSPVPLNLPGSGDMQTQTGFVVGNTFWQAYWRGDQGRTRTIPIENGFIKWASPSAWSPTPVAITALPGSGNLQAQSEFVVGTTLWQTVWRGDEGRFRTVPISSGVIQWNSASGWSAPVVLSTSGFPGTGSIQAQDEYVISDKVWQIIWRDGQQYTRSVPIQNGSPVWPSATGWSNTTGNVALPGSGTFQAQADYVFP